MSFDWFFGATPAERCIGNGRQISDIRLTFGADQCKIRYCFLMMLESMRCFRGDPCIMAGEERVNQGSGAGIYKSMYFGPDSGEIF